MGRLRCEAGNGQQWRFMELVWAKDMESSTANAAIPVRPVIDGIPSTELFDTSFGLIAGIGKVGEVCRKVPGDQTENPKLSLLTTRAVGMREQFGGAGAR